MAIEVQRRFGTTVQHATFTGGQHEITVDTTKNTLIVHDGSHVGGYPLAREDLSNAPAFVGASPTVAGTAGKVPAPAAGMNGYVLYGDGTWKSLPKLNVITETTNARTLAISDTDAYIRFTSATATTLLVPANASVAIAIGATFSGINTGANQLTIAADTGVTINTPETLLLRNKPNTSFVLTKVGTDVWDLAGDLQPAA